MPGVIKAHAHQFLLYELLQAYEVRSPPPRNEVGDAASLPLLHFDSVRDATRIWVLQNYGKNFSSITWQLTMEPSGRLAYQVKASSSNDYMKSYNNSSFTIGRPFITGRHFDI